MKRVKSTCLSEEQAILVLSTAIASLTPFEHQSTAYSAFTEKNKEEIVSAKSC